MDVCFPFYCKGNYVLFTSFHSKSNFETVWLLPYIYVFTADPTLILLKLLTSIKHVIYSLKIVFVDLHNVFALLLLNIILQRIWLIDVEMII